MQAINWTDVIVTLIATMPAILAAVFAVRNHQSLRTPSGDSIGKVVERTHDVTSADLALTTAVHNKVVNGKPKAGP